MRTILPRIANLKGLAAFTLALSLCGAPPQNEGARRETPQPQGPVGGRGFNEGPRMNLDPMPRWDITRRGGQDGENARRATPMPMGPRLFYYGGTRTIVPPALDRLTVMPFPAYWQRRDIMAEIRWMSRRGFIPVTPLGDSVEALSDYVQTPAGWRAYGISVPVGGTLQVEVQHEKLGWFRLMMVDKWGKPGAGMLQQLVTPQPVMLTYKNPGKEATAIYVIVDDPAWWSDAKNPYTLQVRRDWDPTKTDLSQVKMVAGLWGATPSVSAEFRGPSLTGPAVFPH